MIIGRRTVTPEIIDQNTKRRIFFNLMIMSTSIGIDRRPTNGQPSSTDIAVKNIASLYFWWYQAEIADIEKYIENELGSSAAEEMNMPALKIWKTSQERPMWTPNSRQIPLKLQSKLSFRKKPTVYSLVEINLGKCTSKSEKQSDEIKYHHWVRIENLLVNVSWSTVNHQIGVRPQSKLWWILPCLKTFIVQQIMQRLPERMKMLCMKTLNDCLFSPVVESLVTVRDVRPNSSTDSCWQQRFERHIGGRKNRRPNNWLIWHLSTSKKGKNFSVVVAAD